MKAGHPPHDQFKYEKVGVLPIWAYSRVGPSSKRNVRHYYLYRQYTNYLFIFRFVYLLCLRSTDSITFKTSTCFCIENQVVDYRYLTNPAFWLAQLLSNSGSPVVAKRVSWKIQNLCFVFHFFKIIFLILLYVQYLYSSACPPSPPAKDNHCIFDTKQSLSIYFINLH